jgi:hypothetical protein
MCDGVYDIKVEIKTWGNDTWICYDTRNWISDTIIRSKLLWSPFPNYSGEFFFYPGTVEIASEMFWTFNQSFHNSPPLIYKGGYDNSFHGYFIKRDDKMTSEQIGYIRGYYILIFDLRNIEFTPNIPTRVNGIQFVLKFRNDLPGFSRIEDYLLSHISLSGTSTHCDYQIIKNYTLGPYTLKSPLTCWYAIDGFKTGTFMNTIDVSEDGITSNGILGRTSINCYCCYTPAYCISFAERQGSQIVVLNAESLGTSFPTSSPLPSPTEGPSFSPSSSPEEKEGTIAPSNSPESHMIFPSAYSFEIPCKNLLQDCDYSRFSRIIRGKWDEHLNCSSVESGKKFLIRDIKELPIHLNTETISNSTAIVCLMRNYKFLFVYKDIDLRMTANQDIGLMTILLIITIVSMTIFLIASIALVLLQKLIQALKKRLSRDIISEHLLPKLKETEMSRLSSNSSLNNNRDQSNLIREEDNVISPISEIEHGGIRKIYYE